MDPFIRTIQCTLQITIDKRFFPITIVRGKVGKKIILKVKTEILKKLFFQKKVFLHGEKENFEEYSLFLESAELSFAILILPLGSILHCHMCISFTLVTHIILILIVPPNFRNHCYL
jgi:hypothetical protein